MYFLSFITVFQWEFTRFNHHIMFRLRKFGMMHVSKPYIKESSWKKKLISTESFDSKVVFARWFALFTEGTHQVFSSWGFTRKLASIFCGTRHKTLSYLWVFFEASFLFPDQSANHSLDATRVPTQMFSQGGDNRTEPQNCAVDSIVTCWWVVFQFNYFSVSSFLWRAYPEDCYRSLFLLKTPSQH